MNKHDLKAAFAKKGLGSAVVEIKDVGKVMVRELTVGDLDIVNYDDDSNARAHNIALTLYTEDGRERIFDPDSQADLDIIKGLGSRTINKLTKAIEEKN